MLRGMPADAAARPTILPLCRDKEGRTFVPPDWVEGWAVFRLPSETTGGKPGAVRHPLDPTQQLIVNLDCPPDRLLQMCGPGRYRLNGTDEDGRIRTTDSGAPAVVAWTTLSTGAEQMPDARLTPAPQSATEAALIRVIDRQATALESIVQSHSQVLMALAERLSPPAAVQPTAEIIDTTAEVQRDAPQVQQQTSTEQSSAAQGVAVVKELLTMVPAAAEAAKAVPDLVKAGRAIKQEMQREEEKPPEKDVTPKADRKKAAQ